MNKSHKYIIDWLQKNDCYYLTVSPRAWSLEIKSVFTTKPRLEISFGLSFEESCEEMAQKLKKRECAVENTKTP